MIEFTQGNLLLADVGALVNTVNTVGVMGKGIALQFSRAFPEIIKPYEEACESGRLEIGKVHTVKRTALRRSKLHHQFSDQEALEGLFENRFCSKWSKSVGR